MKVSEEYQVLEESLINTIENIINEVSTINHSINKFTLMKYFKESKFINHRFIPRTKMKIFETVSLLINKLCLDEANLLFNDYLKNQKIISEFIKEIDAEVKFIHADSGWNGVGESKFYKLNYFLLETF